MAKRSRIGGFYVERRKDGTFKNWVNVGKSIKMDSKRKAKTIVKSGYGHQGDSLPKKTNLKTVRKVCRKFGKNSKMCKVAGRRLW